MGRATIEFKNRSLVGASGRVEGDFQRGADVCRTLRGRFPCSPVHRLPGVIFGFGLPAACLLAKMVLPVRIELTTSALPRMRSTTELRQHVGRTRAYGRSLALLSTRLAGETRAIKLGA